MSSRIKNISVGDGLGQDLLDAQVSRRVFNGSDHFGAAKRIRMRKKWEFKEWKEGNWENRFIS